MAAAHTGHIEGVHMLIALKADIHTTHHEGCTALMWAARLEHPGCVQLLINAFLTSARKQPRENEISQTQNPGSSSKIERKRR